MATLLLVIGSYISFQVALENAIDLIKVPFANKTIYSHYMINEEDIEWREIPKNYIDENILINKDDVIGKYVSLDSKIAQGSLFYDDYLIEKEEVDALPGLLLKEQQIAFPLSMNLLKSSGNTIITKGLYSQASAKRKYRAENIARVIPHPQHSTPKI